tara:strand:- start:6887 stop:7198 length:312 start_codon:yes stop_codon:yes gene_type:complete
MIRITILEIASFLLPFLVFFVWRWQVNSGSEIEATPTLKLALIGAGLALLMFIGMVLLDSRDGGHEGQVYVPPQNINGRIIPGHFEPARTDEPAETDPSSDPQ